MCRIIIEKMSFAYAKETVLRDISLEVATGDFVAVVGPNGAGKSTLLKNIAGLLQPSQGEIRIGGKSVRAAQQCGWIGYVPQNYAKNVQGFPATVREVVALGLVNEGKTVARTKKAAHHIVNHMLNLVGAESLAEARIGELSGGQQQRVMVAMALAGNPQLLLLDEPTSGVDYDASTRIYELLGTLNRNLGITVVMVSHDIDKAVAWANKVACINRGLCFFGDSKEFEATHAQMRHMWYYTGR